MTTTSGSRFSPPRRVEAGCYRTPVISTSRSLPWRLCTRADCHLFDLADAGGYGVDLVGPGEKSSAEETLPTGSTWSLTVTRTVPRMVARAPGDTLGIICSSTSP